MLHKDAKTLKNHFHKKSVLSLPVEKKVPVLR